MKDEADRGATLVMHRAYAFILYDLNGTLNLPQGA
jgi:hypothetical protein